MTVFNSPFQTDFYLCVSERYDIVSILDDNSFQIVAINESVYVNTMPLHHSFNPEDLIELQASYASKDLMLVHLWEDVWLSRREQVLSRLDSFCGLNKSIHGRKAKVNEVSCEEAAQFLSTHHLQGYIKTKFTYGLHLDGVLLAVACFASPRLMKHRRESYFSAELVRFATKSGFTVVGGLGRLIGRFLQENKVNDLMTYADRDWSLGKGYDKLKFNHTETTSPLYFYFDTTTKQRYAFHRLPKKVRTAFEEQQGLTLNDFLLQNGFYKVFNTGNLKYHLYTNDK